MEFVPVPMKAAKDAARKRFSRESPASWVEGFAIVFWWTWDRQDITERKVAEFLGWSRWKARKLLVDVDTALAGVFSLNRPLSDQKPTKRRPETDHQSSASTDTCDATPDQKPTSDRPPSRARDPLVRDHTSKSSTKTIGWQELWAQMMEVYPSKRKLDWKTWERLIKPAVRKHGKEAVLRGWTYMCRSKDTLWWRQHRKGTKLLSSFLKDDQKKTLTSMIAESEGWDETTEEVPKPAKKQEEESPELKKRLAEIDRKLRNPNWMDDPELKEMAKNLPER